MSKRSKIKVRLNKFIVENGTVHAFFDIDRASDRNTGDLLGITVEQIARVAIIDIMSLLRRLV